MTSPGVIFRDTIIVGFRAPETKPALRGDIRSYDVHTGKLRWIFHTVPRPGEPGYDTWPPEAWKYTGAANKLDRHGPRRSPRYCLCPHRLRRR